MNSFERAEHVTHLGEYGHTDVVVAGLVDEDSQLVWRNWSGDGFLSRLRRQTHCQVLLVRQQIRAGLRADHSRSEKEHWESVNVVDENADNQ